MFRIDFVNVGPQRAGTSWLHRNFINHPDVCLPKKPVKETFFFDEHFHYGLDWYQKHFPGRDGKSSGKVGEFGPSYFDIDEAPQRIYKTNPACKIIISVRNPIHRAFSLFLHHLKRGRIPPDFEEAIQRMPRIITSGYYKRHVQRWAQCFGPDNIHFVLLDAIKESPLQTLNDMCEFLEISPFQADTILAKPVNTAYLPKYLWVHTIKNSIFWAARNYHVYSLLSLGSKLSNLLPAFILSEIPKDNHPVLSEAQRQMLLDIYREDIDFLENLLQLSLNFNPLELEHPPEDGQTAI